jgi:hypothetical protein
LKKEKDFFTIPTVSGRCLFRDRTGSLNLSALDMKRRIFLKTLATLTVVAGTGSLGRAGMLPPVASVAPAAVDDRHLRDYLNKMRRFDRPHGRDIRLDPQRMPVLQSSLQRLRRLERTVGHGNFYLLGFDDALAVARNYSRVGPFTAGEIAFFEEIFYEDGALYGFFGEKPFRNLTDRVPKEQVVKIPHTGNYLYRGRPLELYRKIRKDVGDTLVLTSGIRSVIKQFVLFLDKAWRSEGNLSLASRSLAPPGYSFHGIGDFDVGQRGFGCANFTDRFTETDVFRRLKRLDYVHLRYRIDNLLGVRFEPWHVMVSSST